MKEETDYCAEYKTSRNMLIALYVLSLVYIACEAMTNGLCELHAAFRNIGMTVVFVPMFYAVTYFVAYVLKKIAGD